MYKTNRRMSTAVLAVKSSSCFEARNNKYSETVHKVSQEVKEIGGVQNDFALCAFITARP